MSSRHEADSSPGNCEHHLSEAQGNNKDDSSAYASLGCSLLFSFSIFKKQLACFSLKIMINKPMTRIS